MTLPSDLPTVIGASGASAPLAPHSNWFVKPWSHLGECAPDTYSVVLSHQDPAGAFLHFLAQQIPEDQPRSVPQELTWLPEVYAHVERGDDEAAAELVFDEIDELLTAGEFSRCDELLQMVDVKRLDSNLLISFLAVTLPAKARLPSRVSLLRRVEARLQQLTPDRVEALLRTLR